MGEVAHLFKKYTDTDSENRDKFGLKKYILVSVKKNKNIFKKVLTNKKAFVIIINVVGTDDSQMGA